MLLRIKYNGTRFPRSIALSNHETKSFLNDRLEIEFKEYDAYVLLKNNNRIGRETWEFSIVSITTPQELPSTEKARIELPKKTKKKEKK